MIARLRILFPFFLSSVLNSYTQVFFSNNRVFAVILVLVTFFDPWAGFAGMLSVSISNIAAYAIGFSRENCKAGYYGFNSLLVGLGMGIYYQPNTELYVVLLFAAVLTLFLTIMTEGVIGKYGLPFLSLAFLLGIWMVTLASRQFTALIVSERGIYMLNEMFILGGDSTVKMYNWMNGLPWYEPVKIYFKSLGAILFQYHLLPGILVAAGLLIYSRIAFLLSLVGFASALAYYRLTGANLAELSYGYIGFNFILTSIAIGGFFIIPSAYSFLWVVLLTPLISVFLISLSNIFNLFQLSIYSLPFNLVVLLFLYILKFRERFSRKPEIVFLQYYSPEKNLYSHRNEKERFGMSGNLSLSLPFFGRWKVTQGHDGEYTHTGEWRNAWDFQVTDGEGNNHSGDGTLPEHYYCFGKPVISPADGWVEEVIDTIEDNPVGEVNLEQNWGNSIVLRHTEHLFTKVSHLRKGSCKVKSGDFVKKGDLVASCGNSGRSPVPHLHFQVQSTPYIGSRTLDYPVGHYISFSPDGLRLNSFGRPARDETVANISRHPLLEKAFHLIPGQEFIYEVTEGDRPSYTVRWDVRVDAMNNTFIECISTRSRAWFRYDGDILYFTGFEGNRKSLLFYFYLGAFKVMTGFYKDLEIRDTYPLHILYPRLLILFQDFIAPFHLFIRPGFSLKYDELQDDPGKGKIGLRSAVTMKTGWRENQKMETEFTVTPEGIREFHVVTDTKKIIARQLFSN